MQSLNDLDPEAIREMIGAIESQGLGRGDRSDFDHATVLIGGELGYVDHSTTNMMPTLLRVLLYQNLLLARRVADLEADRC